MNCAVLLICSAIGILASGAFYFEQIPKAWIPINLFTQDLKNSASYAWKGVDNFAKTLVKKVVDWSCFTLVETPYEFLIGIISILAIIAVIIFLIDFSRRKEKTNPLNLKSSLRQPEIQKMPTQISVQEHLSRSRLSNFEEEVKAARQEQYSSLKSSILGVQQKEQRESRRLANL